jgi:membrane-bound metal-dependent hydrolase YbcI (DUF457 family)
MDGSRHFVAGMVAAGVVGPVAYQTGPSGSLGEAASLAGLCLACSQFPDLDTASHAQRWAYRLLAVLMLLWVAGGHWQLAAIAGMLGLLPLLQHHRGWTHRWWAALAVPVGALILGRAVAARGLNWSDPAAVARSATEGALRDFPVLAAMILGYGTHLIADRIPARRR